MRAYSNMPLSQFVQQLRDAAIASKAGPIVVDLLDQLDVQATIEDIEKEREEALTQAQDFEHTSADLHEELANLLDAIEAFPFTDEQADAPGLERALKAAANALKRHK